MSTQKITIVDSLAGVEPEAWDALAMGDPLVSHAFLNALETTGCTGEEAGWLPCHVLLSKADKLKRQQAAKALAQVRRELGDRASVQLFSGTKGQGVPEARACLQALLIGAPLPAPQ